MSAIYRLTLLAVENAKPIQIIQDPKGPQEAVTWTVHLNWQGYRGKGTASKLKDATETAAEQVLQKMQSTKKTSRSTRRRDHDDSENVHEQFAVPLSEESSNSTRDLDRLFLNLSV